MKSLLLLPLLTTLALGETTNLYRVEHINLSKDDASKLMRDSVLTDTDPWETMSGWLKDGTATRLSGATVSTMDDEHFSASGAVEWIYPTEFDPAEMPNHVEIEGEVTRKSMPMTTTTPTAFETRNVGTSIEIAHDDTGKNKFFDKKQPPSSTRLCLSSELVQFRGNIVIGQEESREWIPRFHSRRVMQWLEIPDDRWVLLSAAETPDPKVTTTTWIHRTVPATPMVISEVHSDETNITFVAEWFTIEHNSADRWLSQLGAEPDQSAAYESLQKLVTEDKATPIATRLFIANSGGEVASRAGEEHIYATEVDPAELPHSVGGTIVDGASIATAASPTAFETRELGPEIEVSPKLLGDGEFIRCDIFATYTTLDFDHATGIAPALIHMPLFISSMIKTRTLLQNGKPAFLGAITTPARISPEPAVRICNTPESPPKYNIGTTPRTVFFLTAKVAK